jgi:hypothetical protein
MAVFSVATCAAYIAALASANGGDTIQLAPGTNCDGVTITRSYAPEITISAAGTVMRGMKISGSGVALQGGTYSAMKGEDGSGQDYYALNLTNASQVTVTGATLVSGAKLAVVSNANTIKFLNNVFKLGGDGIIAQSVTNLVIDGNSFAAVTTRPTQCTDTTGQTATVYALSSAACLAKGSNWTWADGWHADAVQMINVSNTIVTNNTVVDTQQGIDDFGGPNDPPNTNVVVEKNDVRIYGYHALTLTNTTDAKIRFNVIRPATNGNRTPIRWMATPGAIVCGNTIAHTKDPGGSGC